MRRSLLIIAALLLALGVVEGVSYWWMHPAPAGLGEPVLVYRPRDRGQKSGIGDRGSEIGDHEQATAQNPFSTLASSPSTINPQPSTSSIASSSIQQSTVDNQQSSISLSSTLTSLPEIYAKSAPMLRCSSGQVLHARIDESAGIHLAFFEWDGTDTGSVLEAFRHMPEACMGSIGMTLVEKAPPRAYVVRGQGTGGGDQGLGMRDQEQATAPSSSSNSTSNIKNSKFATESLIFDHTVFREGGGVAGLGSPIHAFRAIWVAGVSTADARKGLGGDEFDRLRTIRLKSARDRFRPAHARVIQGAVRGISDPNLAWQAFEEAMLKDLSFQ